MLQCCAAAPLDGCSTVRAADGSGEPPCDVGWEDGSAGNVNGKPGDEPSTVPDPRPTTPLYGELVSATQRMRNQNNNQQNKNKTKQNDTKTNLQTALKNTHKKKRILCN